MVAEVATTQATPSSTLRRGVVVLAVVVVSFIAVSIAVVLLVVDDVRDDPESLEDIVTAISRESAALTDLYFYVAEASAEIVTGSVVLADASLDDPAVLSTLHRVVDAHTNVNGAFVGLPDGDFLYVTRSLAASNDGFRVKRVRNADLATRVVTEQQYDKDFNPIGELANLIDEYDPRTRPWYIGALAQQRGWTNPYVFSSSAEPGITHFTQVSTQDGETGAVIGVDLQLTEIRDFLEQRRPGTHGSAAIVARDNTVITGSNRVAAAELAEILRLSDNADASIVATESAVDSDLQVASVARVGSEEQWTLTVVASQRDFPQTLASRIEKVRELLPIIGILTSLAVVAFADGALRRIGRLDRAASTDPLTGLLNRVATRERFSMLLSGSRGERIAALAIDLDGARSVGARWGHEMEDASLKLMTARLADGIGDNGFAGRLEGNEFLAVWTLETDADAHAAVEQLVRSLTEEHESDVPVVLPESVSCGFSLREPGQDVGLVAMLRSTDLALLAARSQKQNVVQFDPGMELPSVRDQHRRSELVEAIERDEFEVHFQPEVRLSDAKVIGAEALLRWRQPDGSFVPAGQFIDDLERLEVIDILSPLIFQQASTLAARKSDSEFTMRINCCANQLQNAWLLGAIEEAHRASTTNWCVEITERTIVTSDEATIAALGSLVDAGVTLALDDFGTGYSSFSVLQNLPITTVKIDRSLVEAVNRDNVTTGLAGLIHDLAKRLSLEVIAEGIETPEQYRALQMIGCTNGQGWLFGRAVTMGEFPQGELRTPGG